MKISKETKQEAKSDLALTNAVIELCKDNTLALQIVIGGQCVSLCDNKAVIPALKKHKKQIKRFLKNKRNK